MATMLSAIEITIWVIIAGTVLTGMHDDPFQAVAYCLAFIVGINLGILIENKLALGLSNIEIIAEFELAKQITNKLRELGFGVTTFDCEGLLGKKLAVNVKVMRKDVAATLKQLREFENVMITITDIREVSAGLIERRMMKRK